MSKIKTYTIPEPPRDTVTRVPGAVDDGNAAPDRSTGSVIPPEPNDSNRLAPDPTELATKMLTGGEDLRDHDFPVPQNAGDASGKPAVNWPKQLDQHQVRSGGAYGEKPGDVQKGADVPTIMDQELSEPSALPDR